MTQVVDDPARRGVLLELVVVNKEGLTENVNTGASHVCSDHRWSLGSCMEEAGQ